MSNNKLGEAKHIFVHKKKHVAKVWITTHHLQPVDSAELLSRS
jgi:hypothetical protein